MTKQTKLQLFCTMYGGKVKSTKKMFALGAIGFLGMGMLLAGCKSAPELTQTDALKMIQAYYDQAPAAAANITVNDQGMGQGVVAKYWAKTKVYPNRFWADFTLTPEGKKTVKLANGGELIQWRPETPNDPHYALVMATVAANHMRAHDIKDIQDVGDTKTAMFTEGVNLDGVPGPLQEIAHNPGNKLSSAKTATFVLDGGAWKLQSVK